MKLKAVKEYNKKTLREEVSVISYDRDTANEERQEGRTYFMNLGLGISGLGAV